MSQRLKLLVATAVMLRTVGQALFSSGLQSPPYTTQDKQQGQDYEVRTYAATKYMSTTVSGKEWDPCTSTGFRRLFNYIQGTNKSKTSVAMTTPVTCRVEPTEEPAGEADVTVSFYLPEEHRENPPEPENADVFVEQRKEMTVYVRTYGGFANEKSKREELQKLMESLRRDGVPFVDKPFYAVGYDSPFKLFNRRNEVWVLRSLPEQQQQQ